MIRVTEGFALRPVAERLIVRPEKRTARSGMLYLPDGSRLTKWDDIYGLVVAIGPGDKVVGAETEYAYEPTECAVGDRIYFPASGATEVRQDGEDLLVIHESHVMAKVHEHGLVPLRDRVCIRVETPEATSLSIHLPERYRGSDRYAMGGVVFRGFGIRNAGRVFPIDPAIQRGVKVLFNKIGAAEVYWQDEMLLLVHAHDIYMAAAAAA